MIVSHNHHQQDYRLGAASIQLDGDWGHAGRGDAGGRQTVVRVRVLTRGLGDGVAAALGSV